MEILLCLEKLSICNVSSWLKVKIPGLAFTFYTLLCQFAWMASISTCVYGWIKSHQKTAGEERNIMRASMWKSSKNWKALETTDLVKSGRTDKVRTARVAESVQGYQHTSTPSTLYNSDHTQEDAGNCMQKNIGLYIRTWNNEGNWRNFWTSSRSH